MVLDGGECECGIESTIIDFSESTPKILRHGGTSREDLEKVCGPIKLGQAVLERPLAPGQLASHYAPNTSLVILKEGDVPETKNQKVGFLQYGKQAPEFNCQSIEVLSEHEQDFKEAAHNLFAALHRLDEIGLDVIYVYEMPRRGLASAIMDRLLKAAAKRA